MKEIGAAPAKGPAGPATGQVAASPRAARIDAPSDYLTATQAAEALNVKVPSLYSYVSRGVIRSVTQPGTRARLYYREDVERAAKRMGGRAGIPDTVETAVRWGQPMLTTSITDLADGGHRYRGVPALELAVAGRSFESVAELLWSGVDVPGLTLWEAAMPSSDVLDRLDAAAGSSDTLTSARLMSLATAIIATAMPNKPDFERGTTVADAVSLISLYACAMGLLGPARKVYRPSHPQSIAQLMANALIGEDAADARTRAAHLRAINATLVVCADHELSPATFAARVAASAGAELRACLHAAIVTQSGIRFGGGCERTEALLASVQTSEALRDAITGYVASGRQVPGFNPVSYPKGDPRARYLIDLASSMPQNERNQFHALDGIFKEAQAEFDLKPRIDVGLVSVSFALGLPRRAAAAMWIIGRCAGWTAHVIEQRLAGFTMRPRAKYVSLV